MKNFAFSGRFFPAIKFNGNLLFVLTILLAGQATSRTLAQAPTVSYSSPLSYTAGTTITSLSPTSSGVAIAGYSNSPVTLMSAYSEPTGIAVDAAGNLYIADQADNEAKKFAAGSTTAVVIGTGFNAPSGVAVDVAGNVYVTDHGNNEIKMIPAGTTTPAVFATGFNQPYGVAVDAAGNVYVADTNNNSIKKVPAGGGPQVNIGTGFNGPLGVAVDIAGNVYVTDYGNNAVKEILAVGGSTVTIGSGFSQPYGIAVDAEGNVFEADAGSSTVREVAVATEFPSTIGSGFTTPHGLAADGAGNVYVGDYGNSAIKEIKPVGGFYLNIVPVGLIFNNSTGTLSGTPAKTASATNYTVTAYNSTGNAQATITITVSPFVISYASPKTYAVGGIITPLSPGGSGVPPQINGGTPVPLSSGFPLSPGLAVDAAGNM